MASTTASLQLSFFPVAQPEPEGLYLPPVIQQAMDMGAALVISVSGGKDSDAMLVATVKAYRAMGWSGPIFALFCDLGRIEWAGALEHIRSRCDRLGVRLVVVKRPQGGLVDRWRQRFEAIAAKPGADTNSEKIGNAPLWSSSQHRYCTSELKEGQADKALRSHSLVICALGIRKEESSNRAKKPGVWVRPGPTTKALKEPAGMTLAGEREQWATDALSSWLEAGRKGRLALNWLPIFRWPLQRVWEELGVSLDELEQRQQLFGEGKYYEALDGFPGHWVYVSGNSRMSCSMCVLASGSDIRNGAILNPLTWLELALLELESGWSFKADLWLASLAELVTRFPLERRRRLLQALYDLNLVRRWQPSYSLPLLASLAPAMTMFWSEAFLSFLKD
jgi:3'-phosphoadenosine 5'-phosphosulfate sulfotransferase (PAPS reductase)/FAD synthetase